MQKRISWLAMVAVASILAGTVNHVHAQRADTVTDGCTVLADVVHGEVVFSALFVGSRMPPAPAWGDTLSCDRTAAAVSSGFARAMSALDVQVIWTASEYEWLSVCPFRDVAQCYPRVGSMMPRREWHAADVEAVWQAVLSEVSRTMPTGTGSDHSSFREDELRFRLGHALANRGWHGLRWRDPAMAR